MDDLVYMTPKEKRCIALYGYGQWIEVYHGELLLVHKKHTAYLETLGMVKSDGVRLHKSRRVAEISPDNRFRVVRGQ